LKIIAPAQHSRKAKGETVGRRCDTLHGLKYDRYFRARAQYFQSKRLLAKTSMTYSSDRAEAVDNFEAEMPRVRKLCRFALLVAAGIGISGPLSSAHSQQQVPVAGHERLQFAEVDPQNPYILEGLSLGDDLTRSRGYAALHCKRSEVFQSFIWCTRHHEDNGANGRIGTTIATLHSLDGRLVYMWKMVDPASFGSGDINREIDRLSKAYKQSPQIRVMPPREGLPSALIVSWGSVVLQPLDAESIQLLASGKSPGKGVLVDFLGNFRQSAQEGLPVYLIGGGAGALWSASYDERGRGNLRLTITDASQFAPGLGAPQASSETPVPAGPSHFEGNTSVAGEAAAIPPESPAQPVAPAPPAPPSNSSMAQPGSDPMLKGVYARIRATGIPTPPMSGGATATEAAPSFDCDRAASPSELAICSTPELSQLDHDLAVAYAALQGDDPQLLASQRVWMQQLNACGGDEPCLRQEITARLTELRHRSDAAGPGPERKNAAIAATATAIAATATGSPPYASDQSAAIGVAATWKLPTRLGLPLVDASSGGVDLVGLFEPISDPRPGSVEWTRAIVALSLSLAPDAVAQMSPGAVISLACLYLPPTRLAALGIDPRRHCGQVLTPEPWEVFKFRDIATTIRSIDLPPIIRAAPHFPLKLLFVVPMTPMTWDERRGGFPIASSAGASLFGAPLRFKLPDFWPASMAVARPFVESRDPHGQLAAHGPVIVYLVLPVTIAGTTDLNSAPASRSSLPNILDVRTGLPDGLMWQFEFGDMTLYGDAKLTQRLFEFGRPSTPPRPVIGAAAAETPHPVAPVPFNTETLILAASRRAASSELPIDWANAAEARMSIDRDLREQNEWAEKDPWGVFFRRRPGDDRKPDAAEVAAFRDWTERRARVFLGSFVFANIPAYPSVGVGPRHLQVFDPSRDKAWSSSSALPFKSSAFVSDKKLPAELARYGVTPSRILTLEMRFAGMDAPVLAVLPRDRQDYVLELPNGVPPRPGVSNDTTSNGSTLDVEVAVDAIEPVDVDDGLRMSKLVLLRVQPIGATLRTIGGEIIASTRFLPTSWPAVTPPPPVLWPPAAPASAEQALVAPYGPELNGVRLGMAFSEAEQVVRAAMPVGRVLDLADSSGALPDDERNFARTIDGRMFVSDDFQNSMAVFASRAPPAGRVVGVWRSTSTDGNHWEKALQTLVAKYGPPVGTPGSAAFWGDRSMLAGRERSWCSGTGVGRAWQDWTEDGRPVHLSASGTGALDGPIAPLLRDAYLPDSGAGAAKLANCFPVLYATTAGGNPSTIETRLFDMRTLVWLRAQTASVPPRTVVAAASRANAPPLAGASVYPKLMAGSYGPDVVGLRLGMTLAEAEMLIRSHMNVTQVAETPPPSAAEALTPSGLFHGKIFVATPSRDTAPASDDRPDDYFRERIAIFDAPSEAAGRVVAIERLVYLDHGLWDRASQQLVAKYGPATESMGNFLVWVAGGDRNCYVNQITSHHEWRVEGGEQSHMLSPQPQEVPLPAADNLQALYPRCGTVIEIYDLPVESVLHTRLYDTALLARLLRNHAERAPSPNALPMKF
jgi:uncharacterized protein